jgi:hypothetical protein
MEGKAADAGDIKPFFIYSFLTSTIRPLVS